MKTAFLSLCPGSSGLDGQGNLVLILVQIMYAESSEASECMVSLPTF